MKYCQSCKYYENYDCKKKMNLNQIEDAIFRQFSKNPDFVVYLPDFCKFYRCRNMKSFPPQKIFEFLSIKLHFTPHYFQVPLFP